MYSARESWSFSAGEKEVWLQKKVDEALGTLN